MSIITKQLTLTGAAGSASASASTHALMQRLVAVEVLRDGQPTTLNVTVVNGARTAGAERHHRGSAGHAQAARPERGRQRSAR